VLIFRHRARHVEIIDTVMTDEDREAVGHYKAVARGWWYVGFGAWCIFLKEGWELAEHRGWTHVGYWLLVVGLTMLALGGGGAGGDREARQRNQRRRHGGRVTTNPGDEPTPAASS
jgi:hypothetical protein